ncbi:fatty acyl-AMP ligase [Polymorphospora rubra]|uniref:AMP-binding protein n=1 Tax=Polymorphospora rubra TaxID=338584 RepID=A0A810NDX3_9ACTN|nr:fatty acyl-AMP ligase [Polymorphospora rubra]BCJ69485.1 AMP-binding protein [Polymorphospora rubra]
MSFDLTDAPNLVTLLRQQASGRPDAPAVAFLTRPDDLHGGLTRWTYSDLDRQARTIAAWLQRQLPAGARVLLLYPSGVDFVAALLGCVYAGMVAVPSPEPGQQKHHRMRVRKIIDSAEVAGILTTSARLGDTRAWAAGAGLQTGVFVQATDLPLADPDQWQQGAPDRSATALLQYTSGSTGEPKGVIVSHDNVLFNLGVATRDIGWPASARLGGWLPLYHDMALQGLIFAALLRGGSLTLMDPMAFIRRPMSWLRLMDLHDINVTFAPNFAYDLCVSRSTDEDIAQLDLSRLYLAGNSSEPVDAAVLTRFAERFAPAGFRLDSFAPVYGLAEITGYVCGRRGRAPVVRRADSAELAGGRLVAAVSDRPGRDVVSCGPPTEACEVRVVDPSSREVLPEDSVGEIWLRGRSVAGGYWGLDNDDQVFGATTADGESGFLRTGDLGVLHEGELHLHGRLKDVLVVRGRKVHPADIEQELRRQHPELGRLGAVFAGAGDGDHHIVVTHEVTKVSTERLPVLAAEIRQTVAREFGVHAGTVLLLRPGAVSRTTSGKVRRSAMRELFRTGALSSVYRDPHPVGASHPAPALPSAI